MTQLCHAAYLSPSTPYAVAGTALTEPPDEDGASLVDGTAARFDAVAEVLVRLDTGGPLRPALSAALALGRRLPGR